MDTQTVISRLRKNKRQLRAAGLREISLFGSTATGKQSDTSDVDLAVRLDDVANLDLFRFAALTEKVRHLLGTPVDIVVEPARNPRIQEQINRDRLRVF
ncbi:MAG: nucleotidyltransferase family protein [Tsuneonella suprasediminis]|uniref:DNA polymerase III subunit beta n=1 Tax=Tsuneonella suprasediminis TaxID=2306996 RepID=A0A419R4Q4_9SPHN|nr:nucleotidyltransferase domain-containing protein [Tsuneonella suprasediminis]RJX69918.1 DNA polymerase III subunit beta [Tsuneonella suprasediminis]UBS31718.1 nucleotidyltransferase domain-containing protein [Altererythrobacter sp. N1]